MKKAGKSDEGSHLYDGERKDGMLSSALNLAEWRQAFVDVGFSDKEALRLVRDVWHRHAHHSWRGVYRRPDVPEE